MNLAEMIEAAIVTDEEIKQAIISMNKVIEEKASPFAEAVARDRAALIAENEAFKKMLLSLKNTLVEGKIDPKDLESFQHVLYLAESARIALKNVSNP